MEKVWITGAGGLIGSELVNCGLSKYKDLEIVPLDHQSLELLDFDAVAQRFEQDKPDSLIHCAAISDSQLCESRPEWAHQINVNVTAFLAGLFAQGKTVFFSTDLVFDGKNGNYSEDDATCPLGVYGQTKVDAEHAVLANPENLVIRTSINGGTAPKANRGFNESLKNAWQSGRTTRLFSDEFRCPIPASITAQATWELLDLNACGIYHIAGAERLSRLDIGRLVANRHPDLNPKIEIGSIRNFSGAPRAADVSLNCAKAQAGLSFKLPGLAEWLLANPESPF